MRLLEAADPYATYAMFDPATGLYSLSGLLLRSQGIADAYLDSNYTPAGLVNGLLGPDALPPVLDWMVYWDDFAQRWENSQVEQLLHQWSDEGIKRGWQWQSLDLVQGAIDGVLRALDIEPEWVGDPYTHYPAFINKVGAVKRK